MKEEIQEGMSSLKKGIIGIVTTAVTAAGAYVTTHIEQVFGSEEEAPTEIAQPVASEQKQEVNVTGPEIIINVPQQQAAPTRVIERVVEKPVPAETSKKKVEEEDEEDPW